MRSRQQSLKGGGSAERPKPRARPSAAQITAQPGDEAPRAEAGKDKRVLDPAYHLCWMGWSHVGTLNRLDAQPIYRRSGATEVRKHLGDADECAKNSILSFLEESEIQRFSLWYRKYCPMGVDTSSATGYFTRAAQVTKRSIILYKLRMTGACGVTTNIVRLEEAIKFSGTRFGGTRPITLLWIPACEGGTHHLLPIGSPDLMAGASIPAAMSLGGEPLVSGSAVTESSDEAEATDSETCEVTDEAASSSALPTMLGKCAGAETAAGSAVEAQQAGPAVAESTAATGQAPRGVGCPAEGQARRPSSEYIWADDPSASWRISEREWECIKGDADWSCLDAEGADQITCPGASVTPETPAVVAEPEVQVAEGLIREPRSRHYIGPWAPPRSYDWVGGEWASQRTDASVGSRFTVAPFVANTAKMAARFVCEVTYVITNVPRTVRQTGYRTVTDGFEVDQTFFPGDVVVVDGVEYTATRDSSLGPECMKLRPAAFTGWGHALRSSLTKPLRGLVQVGRTAEVRPTVRTELAGRAANKAKFAHAIAVCEDPTQLSVLATLRNVAANCDYDPEEITAEAAARFAGELVASTSGRLVGFCGGRPYGWGYCFSCGKERPGRFRGRLCDDCNRGQTTMAQAVADGQLVVNLSHPVQYPGVVKCLTRHPRLKTGVTSWGLREERVSTTPLPPADVLRAGTHQRPGPRLGGFGFGGAIPFVTASGARPLVEAILFRVFKEIPRTADGKAFKVAASFVDQLMPDFCLPGEPMLTWEWIRSMPGRRRRVLVRTLHRLQERGEYHKNFSRFKPFVKTELLPLVRVVADTVTDDVEYVARLIQAPHDETHLVAGRYLKPLVARLKEVWNADNWLFYGSVCPEKLDKWLNRIKDSRSFFWSDYSSFDATHSDFSWDLIEGLYRRIYPSAEPDFWEVLRIWRRPRGVQKCRQDNCKVSYEADTCNASGRDDTALANAIFNGIALALALAAALASVPLEDLTPEQVRRASQVFRVSVVGDDSLVGCSVDVVPLRESIVRNLTRFGLIVKAQSSSRLADVTYLGMMPYPVAGRYYWGPTLGRRMYKAFWMREAGNLPAWTHGVARMLALNQHVPILVECAEKVCELLSGFKHTEQQVDENRVWASRGVRTPRYDQTTIDFICSRYSGLNPGLFRRDTAIIKSVERLPAVVHSSVVHACLLVDEL